MEASGGEAGRDKVDESAKQWLAERIVHVSGDVGDDTLFNDLRARLAAVVS